MNQLQSILMGNFTKPPVMATHRHYNFSFTEVEVKPAKVKPDVDTVVIAKRIPSEDKVYEAINKHSGVTIDELQKYTKLAKATIYKSICYLNKKGLLEKDTESVTGGRVKGGNYIKRFKVKQ